MKTAPELKELLLSAGISKEVETFTCKRCSKPKKKSETLPVPSTGERVCKECVKESLGIVINVLASEVREDGNIQS